MSFGIESARHYSQYILSRQRVQRCLPYLLPFLVVFVLFMSFLTLDFFKTEDVPALGAKSILFEQKSPVYSLDDYTSLSEQTWFGLALSGVPQYVEEIAQETTLNLALKATIAGGNSPRAIILDVSKGTSRMFKLGESILPNVSLVSIERRHILLDNKGKKEALSLPESSLAQQVDTSKKQEAHQAASRTVSSSSKKEYVPLGLRKIDLHQKVTISKLDAVEALSNLGALSKTARVIPRVSSKYGIVGYQFTRMDHNSLFKKVSLQEQDTIVRINGVDVKSKEKVFPVLMSLAKAEKANIVIFRNGKMISLDVYLK